jgi:hypothetical protein
MAICDLTARSAYEQFHMSVNSGNTEVYAVVFFATFRSIIEFLIEKQKVYSQYTIQIANSINIGYTNSSDDSNEKLGNFMPILEYVGFNRTIVPEQNITENSSTVNFASWKHLNIKKSIEHFKEIQEIAYHKLIHDFHTDLHTSEAIIPLFCIFMDHINGLVRLKYQEADRTEVSEVKVSVLGLFKVCYSYDESIDKEIIEYEVLNAFKLGTKNDRKALSVTE